MASSLQEARALKREKAEHRILYEVCCYANHHPGEWDQVRAVKTMHHGVDLRRAIFQAAKLQIAHGFHKRRFHFAIADAECVLLVTMPKGIFVLSGDDTVPMLSDYPHKIVETAEGDSIGLWKTCDA